MKQNDRASAALYQGIFSFFNQHGVSFKGPFLTKKKKTVYGFQWVKEKPLFQEKETVGFVTTIGGSPIECIDMAKKRIVHIYEEYELDCDDTSSDDRKAAEISLKTTYPESLKVGVPLGVWKKGAFYIEREDLKPDLPDDFQRKKEIISEISVLVGKQLVGLGEENFILTEKYFENLISGGRTEEEIISQIADLTEKRSFDLIAWLSHCLLTFRGPFFVKNHCEALYCVDWVEFQDFDRPVCMDFPDIEKLIKAEHKKRTFGKSFSDCVLNALEKNSGSAKLHTIPLEFCDVASSVLNKYFDFKGNMISEMGDDRHVYKSHLTLLQPQTIKFSDF